MSDIYVVYWSGTGNTKEMAEAVGVGIKEAGGNAIVTDVFSINPERLKDAASFALGCPAMGAEELEEGEMEPFSAAVEGFSSGKKIGLFGSYDWGDGEWMRLWEERMEQAGASIVLGAGVIANNVPGEEELGACKALGRGLV